MIANRFEELIIWQCAREINSELFAKFKRCRETYLRNQILRASLSIMSNIAEGFDRRYNGDFARFLSISRGSASEIRSQLYAALDQELLNPPDHSRLTNRLNVLSSMIQKLINSLKPELPSKTSKSYTASDIQYPYCSTLHTNCLDNLISGMQPLWEQAWQSQTPLEL